MNTHLRMNIASVSKILTTIGALQSLAKHHLGIDDPISPYLWPNWTQGPAINTITFRDLLTHRSGFRNDCGGSRTQYARIEQQVSQGITVTAGAAPGVCNNCNFAIFREMLPFMEGQVYTLQTSPALFVPPGQWSADYYINYINRNVLAPVGVPIAGCEAKPLEPNLILSYNFPAGKAHGTDEGDWTLSCGGGRWVLSVDDVYQVANSLANDNVLLTDSQKNDVNVGMNTNNLGWDNSVGASCPGPYVCKNGDIP